MLALISLVLRLSHKWEPAYFTGAMLIYYFNSYFTSENLLISLVLCLSMFIPQVRTRLKWETEESIVKFLIGFPTAVPRDTQWPYMEPFPPFFVPHISQEPSHIFPTILCPHRWHSRSTRGASGLGWSSVGNDCVTETAGSELVPSFMSSQRQTATGAHWTRTTCND